MNILILGDICGPSGREAIIKKLPNLIKKKKLDFVIVNTFNSGLGAESFEKQRDNAEAITTGAKTYPFLNHIPCEDCLRNFENSPSAIMNSRFSDFCKFRYR